ncbi:MAG: xylanase [Microbacterium sp.]|uniref:xylanase n=1 Tax=Microbacterium sp. TaxID=51671 RepID=UPI003A87A6DA
MTEGMPTRAQRRTSRRVRRTRTLWAVAAGVVIVAAAVIGAVVVFARPAVSTAATPTPSVTATPTPTPTPLTPEEQLLASTTDPLACAVSFEGPGLSVDPVLVTEEQRFPALPIPQAEGQVFSGWYATAADAEARSTPARVNGSRLADCTDRRLVLHGDWTTPQLLAEENAGVPILMYHQFTTKPEGEDNWLRLNFVYIEDFAAHLQYIKDAGFYLPTWDELSAFIDGRLYLPGHSVIITDDDADPTWFDLAAPLVAERQLIATSFDITVDGAPEQNPFILRRSHTDDMHRAGDNGQGRMVNLSPEEIAAEMEVSAAKLDGAKEVMAYPFGHYDERSKEGLRLAGFELARTIEPGYVRVGTDKLALPIVRINYGMDVGALQNLIG